MFDEKFLSEITTQTQNYLPQLLIASIILILGWYLSGKLTKIISKAMKKSNIDTGIITFSDSIIKNLFRIAVILAALSKAGVNVTSLIAALGATFVTIGIALKNSLSNIASGVIIIVNKPFKIGDYLEFDSYAGTVKSIDLMFTTLLTPDNREIIMPNSKLTSDDIINCSKQKNRRLDLTYTAKNLEEVEKIKTNFKKIVKENDKVLKDPEASVSINDYNEGNINLTAKVWCKNSNYEALRNEIQENMLT